MLKTFWNVNHYKYVQIKLSALFITRTWLLHFYLSYNIESWFISYNIQPSDIYYMIQH